MSTDLVEVRSKASNQFVKGQSGNPAGRPKGSKNAVTLMKLAIEGELRAQLKPEMSEILTKGIALAKEGDQDMIKYFLDKWISPAKAGTEEDAPRERVQILIGRLDNEQPPVKGRIIEQEST